ncbi:MAG: SIR2 family protein [Fusobacteriaceae bacterium]|nr:SIR2 family protein [Fusobacteriaceae bacterium]
MEITNNLKEIKKIYKKNKLIPFLGAGLSTPYKLPNWNELLKKLNEEFVSDENIRKIIELEINSGEYWEAIENIKFHGYTDDFSIQKKVVDIMLEGKDNQAEDDNYRDIANLDVPFHLTTNYDNNISNYLQSEYAPIILSDAGVSTQKWAIEENMKQVVHLHGTFSKPTSIVLTKEKYDELYNNEVYTNLFSFLKAGFTFLFIGFSYSDKYIEYLVNLKKDIFNDYHYILMANPTPEIRREFLKNYKIHVIPYQIDNLSDSKQHILAIRTVLEYLEKESVEENF